MNLLLLEIFRLEKANPEIDILPAFIFDGLKKIP
jgi:hypothetical protein